MSNELSQQNAACCWYLVRWGLSRCVVTIMNHLLFSLTWYPLGVKRSSFEETCGVMLAILW